MSLRPPVPIGYHVLAKEDEDLAHVRCPSWEGAAGRDEPQRSVETMKTELGDRGQRLLEALQALAEPEAEFETREEAGRILLKLLPPLVGAHLNDKLSAENAGRLFDDVVGHVSEAACRRRLPGSLAAFRGTTPGEAVTWIRIIAYRRAVDLLDNEKREQPCDPGELPAERGGRFAAERDL